MRGELDQLEQPGVERRLRHGLRPSASSQDQRPRELQVPTCFHRSRHKSIYWPRLQTVSSCVASLKNVKWCTLYHSGSLQIIVNIISQSHFRWEDAWIHRARLLKDVSFKRDTTWLKEKNNNKHIFKDRMDHHKTN